MKVDVLELAKGLKDLLDVLLGEVEVQRTNVESGPEDENGCAQKHFAKRHALN